MIESGKTSKGGGEYSNGEEWESLLESGDRAFASSSSSSTVSQQHVDPRQVWKPARSSALSNAVGLLVGTLNVDEDDRTSSDDQVPLVKREKYRTKKSSTSSARESDMTITKDSKKGEAEDTEEQRFVHVLEEIAAEIEEGMEVDLAFEDIRFSIEERQEDGSIKEKVIVHPISGKIEAGSLVALMGPSGCGKTTLLDMLADKKTTPYTGTVYVNGHPRTKQFRRLVSYVPQFDYGSGLETVRESVEFVSRMKADYGTTKPKEQVEQERQKHIDNVLAVLGLAKVANSRVGNELVRGISGGQKRRCTLAKSLITGPFVLFADEPTSGLSSTDSETAMRALKNVCQYMRMSCICVIHQPKISIFEMFDKLILLSDGRCVYQGPATGISEYLGSLGHAVPPHVNPADWVLDCVTPGTPQGNPSFFVERYQSIGAKIDRNAVQESIDYPGKSDTEILMSDAITRGAKDFLLPTSRQTWLVTMRALRLTLRDSDTLSTLILSQLVTGLLVGFVYFRIWQEPEAIEYQLSFLFIFIVAGTFACIATIPILVQDKVVFLNERAEGLYSSVPYMISRVIVGTGIAVLGSLLMSLTSYFLAGFPADRFAFLWFLDLATYLAVDALMSIFATASSNAIQANSLASLLITVFTLFNGFTANTRSTPPWVSWVCFLSPYYFAFWSALSALFDDQALLDRFGFTRPFQWQSIGILLGFAVAFRCVQFLLLEFAIKLVK